VSQLPDVLRDLRKGFVPGKRWSSALAGRTGTDRFLLRGLITRRCATLGLIPQVALPPITHIAATLTTIAMAALGLGVDIRVVAKSGIRVTLAVTASLIVLGLISYALIRVAGIP
jgi:uncharacterized membrane protein YadS